MAPLWTLLAVMLLAGGCAGAPAASPVAPVELGPLEGTSWRAEDIDGAAVADEVKATLSFDAGQKVLGWAACNRYFGTYLQVGDALEIKPGGSTRMACAPAVMDQEFRFFGALDAVRKAKREGEKLLLLDGAGRVRIRLTHISRLSAEANVLAATRLGRLTVRTGTRS